MPRIVLTLHASQENARALVDTAMAEAGWRVGSAADGERRYVRGSRGRTIILGALAGSAFYLEVASTAVERRPGVTDVDLRWGEHHGLLLGGALGRIRAEREMARTHTSVLAHLAAAGVLHSAPDEATPPSG